jgi:hypothetical protein
LPPNGPPGYNDPYGNPYASNPYGMSPGITGQYDPAVAQILNQEGKRKDLYYRVAEIATNRGDVSTAIKYLQAAEYADGKQQQQGDNRKSFLDEVLALDSEPKKLNLLKKLFGAEDNKGEDLPDDLKKMRMYGEMAKDIIPSVRANIIDPIVESIGGENKSVSQLEREVGPRVRPEMLRQGPQGRVGPGTGFREVERITKQRKPVRPPPALEADIEPSRPRVEIIEKVEREVATAEVNPSTPPTPPTPPPPLSSIPLKPSDQIKERVELAPEFNKEVKPDPEDDVPLNEAEDYGQPITSEDLSNKEEGDKVFKKVEELNTHTMSIDEKYTINNLFPRFKTMILKWDASKKSEDKNTESLFSPDRTAREDFHTMTKSSYAIFIGKKRLLKAYHAAKVGYDELIGKYKVFIEKQLDEARKSGMDMAAEKLREVGVKDFEKMWEPPMGMDRKAGVKQLLKYLILKDCWVVFTTDSGKEWFKKYCEEFVKAVDEDYNKDDKREKIRRMLESPNISKEKKEKEKEVVTNGREVGEIQGKGNEGKTGNGAKPSASGTGSGAGTGTTVIG